MHTLLHRSAPLPLPFPRTPLARTLATVAIAAVGALLFQALHIPVPFLFGPLFISLVAALAGLPLRGTGQIGVGARTILGVAIGSSLTPALAAKLPDMALSVALVPLYILAIAAVGVPFFRRLCGFDPVTSWYAAMPGGLQDMVIFGTEAGGDPRALSLIHATRVLIVVMVAPLILVQGMDAHLSHPVGAPALDVPAGQAALMVFAALAGWLGAERIGMFGASILGPMLLTAVLSLMGLIEMRPPREAILAAQFIIGMSIGVGYAGITLAEIRRYVLSGAAFVIALAGLAALATEVVVRAGLAGPVEGFLAFAPGGQAEMTVLSIVAGADLGYVIVHHVTRVLLVIIGAPVAARLMSIRQQKQSPPDRKQ